YKNALFDMRRILALPLLPTHLFIATNVYIIPKFIYMGTMGFLTLEQCNKVDTEIKKKVCKAIRYPFEAFPCSYMYSSRDDGGVGIISLRQTVDVSRASALIEA
ncbi:hypothetical protein ADUPG1_004750, partial [Aduncisulcus paluster]